MANPDRCAYGFRSFENYRLRGRVLCCRAEKSNRECVGKCLENRGAPVFGVEPPILGVEPKNPTEKTLTEFSVRVLNFLVRGTGLKIASIYKFLLNTVLKELFLTSNFTNKIFSALRFNPGIRLTQRKFKNCLQDSQQEHIHLHK